MMYKVLGLIVISFMCNSVAHKVYAQGFTQHESKQSGHTSNHNIELIAKKWNLSVQEYQRYLEIMKGPLSRWNPNIDPVFALGIFAESEVDQIKYAEILARQEYQLTLRTLEFERAYRSAFKRLYPNARLIDKQLLKPYFEKKNKNRLAIDRSSSIVTSTKFLNGDRILYFPDKQCRECRVEIDIILNAVKQLSNVLVDIYVVGTSDQREVQRWAINNGIDVEIVGQRITLNMDNGLYKKVNAHSESDTDMRLFLSRNNQLYSIERNQLL